MTVAQRLYLLVFAAIVGLVGLATLSFFQIESVYKSANFANENVVPSLVVLNDTTKSFSQVRVRVYRHVLNTDTAKMAEIEDKIKEAENAVEASFKRYEPLIADEKDRQMLNTNRALYAEYKQAVDEVLVLSRANKNDQARELLTKNAGLAERLNAAIVEHFGYNEEIGKKAADEALATKASSVKLSIVISILVLIFVGVMGFLIVRNLQRQLGGEPAYAAEVVKRIAAGDLTVQVATQAGDTSSMLVAIKGMVEKLSEIITQVRSSADSLASASEEISATAQSLSQSASEQAAGVEETTASMEEMSASIEQNTENAKVTDSMASKAAKEATEGGEAVSSTVEAMKKIAGKIGIVDDIAYQTNLLALNAAIEAARAGEHGKGFAVVAAEVRKLAERSQVAAQEIGELASSSVNMAERAGKLLDEIVPSINKTSDLVQEISSASSEQSSGVAQINSAMGQLNQTTQQNASASEELAATAEEMSSQTEQLQNVMTFFKLDNAGSSVRHSSVKRNPVSSKAVVKKSTGRAQLAQADEQDFERF